MKNVRSFVMNCVLVLLAVLTLGFLAGDYVYGTTGYDMLEGLEYVSYYDAATGMLIVSALLILILVVVLAVLALVGLLFDFEVVKAPKAAKILRFVEMVLACLICAFSLIALIIIAVQFETVGWAVVLNFIIALGLVAVPVVDLVLAHKKK